MEIVRGLIGHAKADVNVQDGMGTTALIAASKWGYSEVVEALIKREVNLNCKDREGNNALIFAAQWGILVLSKP